MFAVFCIFTAWVILACLCCTAPARFRRNMPQPPAPDGPPEGGDYPTTPIEKIPPVPAPSAHLTDVLAGVYDKDIVDAECHALLVAAGLSS